MADKEKPINYFIVLEPVSSLFGEVLEIIQKRQDGTNCKALYFSDSAEATAAAFKHSPCLVAVSFQTPAQLLKIIAFVKSIFPKIESGEVKVIAINKIATDKLTGVLNQLKVSVVVREPISARTLMFKVLLQIKALDSARKAIELKAKQKEILNFKVDSSNEANDKARLRFKNKDSNPEGDEKFVLNGDGKITKKDKFNVGATEGPSQAWQKLKTEKIIGSKPNSGVTKDQKEKFPTLAAEDAESDLDDDISDEKISNPRATKNLESKRIGKSENSSEDDDDSLGFSLEKIQEQIVADEVRQAKSSPETKKREPREPGLNKEQKIGVPDLKKHNQTPRGHIPENSAEGSTEDRTEGEKSANASREFKSLEKSVSELPDREYEADEKKAAIGSNLEPKNRVHLKLRERGLSNKRLDPKGNTANELEDSADEADSSATGPSQNNEKYKQGAQKQESEKQGSLVPGKEKIAEEGNVKTKTVNGTLQPNSQAPTLDKKNSLSPTETKAGNQNTKPFTNFGKKLSPFAKAKLEQLRNKYKEREIKDKKREESQSLDETEAREGTETKKRKSVFDFDSDPSDKSRGREDSPNSEKLSDADRRANERGAGKSERLETKASQAKKKNRDDSGSESSEIDLNIDFGSTEQENSHRSDLDDFGRNETQEPISRRLDQLEDEKHNWRARNFDKRAKAEEEAEESGDLKLLKVIVTPEEGEWHKIGPFYTYIPFWIENRGLESLEAALPICVFEGIKKPKDADPFWIFSSDKVAVLSKRDEVPESVLSFLGKFLKEKRIDQQAEPSAKVIEEECRTFEERLEAYAKDRARVRFKRDNFYTETNQSEDLAQSADSELNLDQNDSAEKTKSSKASADDSSLNRLEKNYEKESSSQTASDLKDPTAESDATSEVEDVKIKIRKRLKQGYEDDALAKSGASAQKDSELKSSQDNSGTARPNREAETKSPEVEEFSNQQSDQSLDKAPKESARRSDPKNVDIDQKTNKEKSLSLDLGKNQKKVSNANSLGESSATPPAEKNQASIEFEARRADTTAPGGEAQSSRDETAKKDPNLAPASQEKNQVKEKAELKPSSGPSPLSAVERIRKSLGLDAKSKEIAEQNVTRIINPLETIQGHSVAGVKIDSSVPKVKPEGKFGKDTLSNNAETRDEASNADLSSSDLAAAPLSLVPDALVERNLAPFPNLVELKDAVSKIKTQNTPSRKEKNPLQGSSLSGKEILSRAEEMAAKLKESGNTNMPRRSRGQELALKIAMADASNDEDKVLQALHLIASCLRGELPDLDVSIVYMEGTGRLVPIGGATRFNSYNDLKIRNTEAWTSLPEPKKITHGLGLVVESKLGAPLNAKDLETIDRVVKVSHEILPAA